MNCGKPCLFHIQSNLSNQPTHTHSPSLQLDFLIMTMNLDVKNISLVKGRFALLGGKATLNNNRSSCRLSRRSKDAALRGLAAD